MENLRLLSGRLQWCVDRKVARDPHGAAVTRTKIASVAERSRAAVTYWFQDVNGLDAEAARKLGEFFGVDPVWLETGEGSPEVSAEPPRRRADDLVEKETQQIMAHVIELLSIYSQANDRERRHIDGAVDDVRQMMSQRAAVNQR